MDSSKYFEQYKLLVEEIDKNSKKLEKQHSKNMVCRRGCDMCCMDYNIFPIEFYSILHNLKQNGLPIETSVAEKENSCIFLKNHVCTIYAQRPVICRTHGLPLLFMNEDSEWELSVCELNFTEYNFERFNLENTFPQDKFNSKLFMLNKSFIAEFDGKEYGEKDLIPLRNLSQE